VFNNPLDFFTSLLTPDAMLLCAFAFLAGFVDSIVGGGGLIQLPALFIFAPQVDHATIFGTNKLSSICGTSVATLQYARRIDLDWHIALLTAAFAFSLFVFGRKGCEFYSERLFASARAIVAGVGGRLYGNQ
jgi:uncharacterized membrane protein YfcA